MSGDFILGPLESWILSAAATADNGRLEKWRIADGYFDLERSPRRAWGRNAIRFKRTPAYLSALSSVSRALKTLQLKNLVTVERRRYPHEIFISPTPAGLQACNRPQCINAEAQP